MPKDNSKTNKLVSNTSFETKEALISHLLNGGVIKYERGGIDFVVEYSKSKGGFYYLGSDVEADINKIEVKGKAQAFSEFKFEIGDVVATEGKAWLVICKREHDGERNIYLTRTGHSTAFVDEDELIKVKFDKNGWYDYEY